MLRSALVLVLLLAAGSCASSPAYSQEPPKGNEEAPSVSPAEREALALALQSLNMDLEDLHFKKDVAPSDDILPAVRSVLDDPLSGVARTDALAGDIAAADPASTLLRLGSLLADVPGTLPGPPAGTPSGVDAWRKALAPLATDEDSAEKAASTAAGLPAPLQAALADIAETLPRAHDRVRRGFAALSPEEKDVLRQWGRLLTIANDAFRKDFTPPDPERASALRAMQPGVPPLKRVLEAGRKVEVASLAEAGALLAALAGRLARGLAEMAGVAGRLGAATYFRMETRFGLLWIRAGRFTRTQNAGATFLIDLGGDDVYPEAVSGGARGDPGRPLSLLVDLGGDDVHVTGAWGGPGSAFLGASAFLDVSGNDVYRGGDLCQGAALFGAATFVDESGDDDYRAGAFCQGAASFGVALLADKGGKDRYLAGEFAQAFARTLGAACLHDRAGHDSYRAGGRTPYLPLYEDRHFCHSQGFAIGVREHGAAGGIALLLDEAGNDVYAGEVHGQGAACWYGLGMLVDRSGCDRYSLTFNGQGGAVHSSAGILIDEGGDDSYVLDDGMGQGAGHDLAVGVLSDRGGMDRYLCRGASQGVGLTNGVGILLERAGNDVYAAGAGLFQGGGRAQRGYGSIGLFVDLSGRDAYASGPPGVVPGLRGDGEVWHLGAFGCGVDLGQGSERGSGKGWERRPVEPGETDLPEGYAYTKERFDELFAVASLWDVGVDRPRVAAARGELIAWGERALPHLERMMGRWGGLHFYALDGVLCGIAEDHGEEVRELVLRSLGSPDSITRANAFRLAGKLALREASPILLQHLKDPAWRGYAVGPVGELGLEEAVPVLVAWLDEGPDASAALSALRALGRIADPSSLPAVMKRFTEEAFPVRFAAVRAASRFGRDAVDPLVDRLQASDASVREKVHALQALRLTEPACKDASLFAHVECWMDHEDWRIRAEAAKLAASFPSSFSVESLLRSRLEKETHAYVRGVLRAELAISAGKADRDPSLRSGIVDYPEYDED